jgi:hypothetical protein
MKRVFVKNFLKPDKTSVYLSNRKYCVALGNGVIIYLSSEKACNKLLAETGRMLTAKTEELNFIYVQIFNIYRTKYFFLKDLNLTGLIENINNKFDKCLNMHNSENANYFTFNNLHHVIRDLTECCDLLYTSFEKKLWFSEMHFLEIFQTMLKEIKTSLDNYGSKLKEAKN